jgi:hypothetical protein
LISATEFLAMLLFTLFSLADLRFRTAPLIGVFFLASVLLTAPTKPLNVLLVVLAIGWGLIESWPGKFALALALYPPNWPILLTGFGVRRDLVGQADLLAAARWPACSWPALVLAFVSLELWRRGWCAGIPARPALPGMLLGIVLYIILRTLLA